MNWRDRLRAARAGCGKALGAIANATAAVISAFDLRDATMFVGLALLGYGLYDIYPPLAFAVPGAALSAVSYFGVRA
jgi:hypothetical protein